MSTPWQNPEQSPEKDPNSIPQGPYAATPPSDPYMSPPGPSAGVPYSPAGYGAPGAYGPGSAPKPDNYLAWAILATLLCCVPFGVPAIVYASRVDAAWFRGDLQGAQAASRNAKKWALISLVAGIVGAVLYALFWVLLLVLGEASDSSMYSDTSI